MVMLRRCGTIFFLIINNVIALSPQDYNDYQDYQDQDYQDQDYQDQDNLYHDYAEKEQRKNGGGIDVKLAILFTAVTCIAGAKIHSSRATKKLKSKFQKSQKALYTQYYNDVYKLTNQNNEISEMVKDLTGNLKDTKDKAELDAIQRDYEEFKQPDIDGDDRISRGEFNMYVKNYLSNYPGLQEKDYPTFEDFDHDGDGYVGFKEYAQQMALQVQQAEADQFLEDRSGGSSEKVEAMQGLLSGGQSSGGGSFEDIYGQYLS